MLSFIPFAVCIIGLLLFGFSDNAKIQTIGTHMFWCGLLVFLLQCAGLGLLGQSFRN